LPMIAVPYVEIRRRTLTKYDVSGLTSVGEGAPALARSEIAELVSEASDKFEKLYLADMEGIGRNKPQLGIAQVICETIPTFYEGGVRYANNVIDMLITGAEKCVVGTATLSHFDDLRGAFKLSENITLKVDYRDGIVGFDEGIAGRTFLSLARDVRDIGITEMFVPSTLASEAAGMKEQLGISLGVFAPMSERSRLEQLGVDYIVAGDIGGLGSNE